MQQNSLLRGAIAALFFTLSACGGSSDGSSSAATSAGAPSAVSPAAAAAATQVALSAAAYVAPPATTTVMVTVNRAGTSQGVATVSYATANGTAIAGTDYAATSGTLTWADGDTTAQTVAVPVANKGSAKVFDFNLVTAAGAASLGSPASATVTLDASTAASSSSSSGAASTSSSSSSSSSSSGVASASGSSSGAAASSSSSSSGSSSSSSSSSGTNAFSIAVSGTHLVNGSGKVVQLRGANVSGLEAGVIFGSGNSLWSSSGFNGRPDFTKLAAWKLNAVRLPLNEDSWLGLTVKGVPGNTIVLNGAAYQAEVAATVAAANAAGLYVILDLHWSAPSNFAGNLQNPMADADNSVNFWTSVAETFKSNPAVLFELFNEPYFDPTSQGDGAFNSVSSGIPNTVANQMLRNGGTANYYFGLSSGTWGSSGEKIAYTWQVAGYQTLINAVRATGATNVILCGGNRYSDDLTWWGQNAPTDPAGQLAAAIHLYAGGYPNNFATGSGPVDSMLAANVANYPVVVTEFGDEVGSANATYTQQMTAWLDLHGYSATAWAWNPWSQSSNVLIQNASSYTPTVGFGQTYHDWAYNHAQ